ncbi:hypothetical protein AB2B38_011445 [Balneola sp. MJW-20]|uniref:hypothetical protein n=1 Tax=Gracilimonas aurantiaca TaxID=3234185 RepID=UPI003467AE82
MSFRIQTVKNSEDIRAFQRLPFDLHGDNEQWCPPFREEIEKIFDEKRNERFRRGGECERFIVLEDGLTIGRFSLFTDPEKDERYDPKLGGMGLLELADKEGIMGEIIKFAKEWFTMRGYHGFRGPINFGENDRYWGVQLTGFDSPNVYGMLTHAPYYESHVESTNPEKFDDLYMYNRKIMDEIPERLKRITDRLINREGVEIRPISKKDLETDGEYIRQIYNTAFSDQVVQEREEEFTGISRETIRQTIQKVKPVLMPETSPIVFIDGEPASFLVSVPDMNEISVKTGGELRWWHLPRVLTIKKKVSRIRPLAFGTVPKHRGKGLEALIWRFGIEQLRIHYPNVKEMEGGFVSEKNWIMRRSLEALGCTISKTYRVYKWIF